MAVLDRLTPVLLLLIHTLAISALPPKHLQPSLSLHRPANATKPNFLTKDLTFFPPGPPDKTYFYIVPDSDLCIEFFILGHIRHRNESLVREVLLSGIYDALEYRPSAKLPFRGYGLQVREFRMAVTHSVSPPLLTWRDWLDAMRAMQGYVRAYPGWDFGIRVRRFRHEGDIEGFLIGAGFAETKDEVRGGGGGGRGKGQRQVRDGVV